MLFIHNPKFEINPFIININTATNSFLIGGWIPGRPNNEDASCKDSSQIFGFFSLGSFLTNLNLFLIVQIIFSIHFYTIHL